MLQKRVARIVAVIAGALIIMSVLLVTVTMRMSDHIDDMGEYSGPGTHGVLTPFNYDGLATGGVNMDQCSTRSQQGVTPTDSGWMNNTQPGVTPNSRQPL